MFKFDDVAKLKLHKALLFLSYEAEKNRIEANAMKRKK